MARKILLADDSVTAQNMGRRILTDAGYEVVTVNNGSAAMKKVAEIKPDLIVLDVYMPGYGGLEICQRVRETPELSRIPILLTVGKLEPFKADDAKRVRADAFVIKPFDASELLAALTKLEDKIVPTKSNLSGRFARAAASIDEAKSGKEFGDTDSGWKSRLKIPAPYSKPHNAHADASASEVPAELHEEVAAAKQQDIASAKEVSIEKAAEPEKPLATKPDTPVKTEERETEKVASILPPEVASALPADVTPEEIEAITAAAAMLAQHAATESRTENAEGEESPAELVARLEEAVASSAPSAETNQPAETSAEPKLTESSGEPEIEAKPAAAEQYGQDEVIAALASLAPSSLKVESANLEEAAPVTMATAPVAQYSGPRWIAEEISMDEDDSTSVLELEMERSYAAFAAADAARMFLGDHRPAYFANGAEAERSTAEPAAAKIPEVEAASVTIDAVAHEEPARPAEVAAESPLPAPVVSEEAQEVPEGITEVSAASEPVSEPTAEAEPDEKAAYAVAAASSSGVVISEVPVASAAAPSVAESEEQRQSALATAWANWKQVRESTVEPQPKSENETSISGFRDFRSEPTSITDQADIEEESTDESLMETSEDASEVANIVDSVLADLKPKLMKEIAQKMGKGKKKKKKS